MKIQDTIAKAVKKWKAIEFKIRGKHLTDIENGIDAFFTKYGRNIEWGHVTMYDGPAFPLYEDTAAFTSITEINKKFILLQDMYEDDIVYQVRIGSMGTWSLSELSKIIDGAMLNPPPAPEAGQSYEVVTDEPQGLKIVGAMPLDLLARQCS